MLYKLVVGMVFLKNKQNKTKKKREREGIFSALFTLFFCLLLIIERKKNRNVLFYHCCSYNNMDFFNFIYSMIITISRIIPLLLLIIN